MSKTKCKKCRQPFTPRTKMEKLLDTCERCLWKQTMDNIQVNKRRR